MKLGKVFLILRSDTLILFQKKAGKVDLDDVEALSDDNTVAMVIINPGNLCGTVFKYEHLKKVISLCGIENYYNEYIADGLAVRTVHVIS